MPPTIPPVLEQYYEEVFAPSTLTLLTSVLATPANWLLVRFLVGALRGVGNNSRYEYKQQDGAITHAAGRVVFVSFYRSFDLWTELSRKIVSSVEISMNIQAF